MKKEIKYGNIFDVGLDEPVYTSGVINKLLGIPVWVLKQLDKENIIRPLRKKGKSRLYSKNELNKLSHIWYLMKEKGVKVDGLKIILEMEEKMFAKT
ncbi:MAG: MerR family transcriptional regulator [Patescibacteria group bacterium]